MPTHWRIQIDVAQLNRAALIEARREVTDTTRRVYNRTVVLTPVRFGLLRAQNKMTVRVVGRSVVGEVFNETEYALAVHDGSPARTIVPRRKKALRFEVDGKVVYARKVRMPARRGRPFMYRALVEVTKPRGYRITGNASLA